MFAISTSRSRTQSTSHPNGFHSSSVSSYPDTDPPSASYSYPSDLARKDIYDSSLSCPAPVRHDLAYDHSDQHVCPTTHEHFVEPKITNEVIFSSNTNFASHANTEQLSLYYTKSDDLPVAGQRPIVLERIVSGNHASPLSASSSTSGDLGPLTPTMIISQERPPGPVKLKKPRREKPKIELAPDQPPTTQGKPRERVYVACIQCRARKIRCDGAKPACHNCRRRTNGNSECTYDPVPKRRGPDKTPGARQRLTRDVKNQFSDPLLPTRRRRRTRDVNTSDPGSAPNQGSLSPTDQPIPAVPFPTSLLAPPTVIDTASSVSSHDSSQFAPLISPIYPHGCGCQDLAPCPDSVPVPLIGSSNRDSSLLYSYNDAFDWSNVTSYGVHPGNSTGYISELDENGNELEEERSDMISQPSLSFTRKIWWDSLLSLYISPTSTRLRILTVPQRETAAQGVVSDLRFVFKASNYWFSFFHIPSFFSSFFDPVRRERMQPALVLSLLAMSTFWQSSEIGLSDAGRERALRFRDEAQGALEASFNTGWIDETLAQAAWLLALFEVCAHPRHSSERCTSALIMLDSIIRSFSLTLVDADDPTTTMFLPGAVPIVPIRDQSRTYWFDNPSPLTSPHVIQDNVPSSSLASSANVGCSCNSITLAERWPLASEHAPMWGRTPAWNESWSEAEIRKESCRRLCWSAMVVAAGHISYTTAHRSHNPDLFIADPANYALLFSGESVARSPTLSTSSKDTVWALQDRCFLLWHACIRMRNDPAATDADKAQFAARAWLEADALESTLNKHTCSIERAFIYQAREYIFNSRMSISYEFQRYIPLATTNMSSLFHRKKAEEWLRHQATVAERFMHGLHTITGNANNLLARRPFFVFWFMGQISRSLSLWHCDNTLIIALDVCKALLPAIDYLSALWPCPEQRHRYQILRGRLDNACYAAGVSLPPPPNFSLPPSSPEALV